LKINPLWQHVDVVSSDMVTVFVTMDRKYGANDIKNAVKEIFEKAPNPNGGPAEKRVVIVHF
jgi:hypothetical protein